jgi:glyceraldehyde-3-phosphate dehydrogenase (NAD(P))
MAKISVGLAGFGSQGRRVATAILLQPDMEIKGVLLREPDISAVMAFENGLPIFITDPEYRSNFEEKGIRVSGSATGLIDQVHLMIDCTPPGVGIENKKKFYTKNGLKAIFQAGEEPNIAEIPAFISGKDYRLAKGARFVRLPSPCAVATVRTMSKIGDRFGFDWIASTVLRAGSETMRASAGPIGTFIPEKPENCHKLIWEVTHHLGKDMLVTVVRAPSLFLHVETIFVQLKRPASRNEITAALASTPRIALLPESYGLNSTDSIFEFYRRIGPGAGDIYEICVWQEQIQVHDAMAQIMFAFDSHSVHIPEEIDAIRALVDQVSSEQSQEITDHALGIKRPTP